MTDINRKVMKQEEVEKRIVIAGTCVDIRPPRHIGNEYYLPRPNLNADNTEIYSTDPETCLPEQSVDSTKLVKSI